MDGIKRARVRDILILASAMSGLDARVITGQGRERAAMRVRQAVCKVAREHGHSLPFIGRLMGGRDHTTIMHSCRAVDVHYPRDRVFAAFVDELRRQANEAEPFLDAYTGPIKVVEESPLEPSEPAPAPATMLPRNDFAPAGFMPDKAHLANERISRGSSALLAAIERERGL